MKKLSVQIGVATVIALLAALATAGGAGAAGGAHAKATGDVQWTSSDNSTRHAIFDAHDEAPADDRTTEDRGSLFHSSSDGWSFEADVLCVEVDGETGEAWFKTQTTAASPTAPGVVGVGTTWWWHVTDNGSPGVGADTWRASNQAGSGPCDGFGNTFATFTATAGNISVKG